MRQAATIGAFAPALPDPKAAFELFHDRIGRWCVRRLDGLVFGTFRERQPAMRFAQRECRDAERFILIDNTRDEPEVSGMKTD